MSLLNPLTPLSPSNGSIVYKTIDKLSYTISSLFKGKVKVITENKGFPSNTCIGLLASVGLKDEDNKTIGSCEALSLLQRENIHLYSLSQLTGGELALSFNEETIYSSCSCLPNDTENILKGLIDSVYKTKSKAELNIIKDKANIVRTMKVIKNINQTDQEVISDLMMNRVNKNGVFQPNLNQFIKEKISKSNAIIVANGIEDHQSFSNKVNQVLSQYISKDIHIKETKNQSQFRYKQLNAFIPHPHPTTKLQLLFPSVGWNSPSMPIFVLIAQIFGSSQAFSSGGPGKGIFTRSYLNVLSKKSHYINECSCINFHHSDFGVFGLSFDSLDNELRTMKDMIDELLGLLNPISKEELIRAKRIIKRRILTNLANGISRCEETAKSMFYFNKIMHNDFIGLIEKVTSDDINKEIRRLLNDKERLGLVIKSHESKAKLFPLLRDDVIKLF